MKQFCRNHPLKGALDICNNCNNYFCAECLNKAGEHYYCNNPDCYKRFLTESPPVRQGKKSKAPLVIGIAAAFIILASAAAFFVFKFAEKTYTDVTEFKADNAAWKVQQVGHSGLSINIPFELKEIQVDIPAEAKSVIIKMENFQYDTTPLNVGINYTVYMDGIPLNIDGAAQGSMNNVQLMKEVAEMTYEISANDKDEFQVRVIHGRLKYNNQPAEYKGYIYLKDRTMWMVHAIYLDNDTNRETAIRILDSVTIEA